MALSESTITRSVLREEVEMTYGAKILFYPTQDNHKTLTVWMNALAKKFASTKGSGITEETKTIEEYTKKLINRYSKVRILGKKEELSMDDIYIDVNLFENPSNFLNLSPEEIDSLDKYYKRKRKITHNRINALDLVGSENHIILHSDYFH